MTRMLLATLLLLATTGCDAALGLPTDGSLAPDTDPDWSDQDEQDASDEGADEDVEDWADDEDFVPPLPLDGDDVQGDEEVCVLGEWIGGWSDDPALDPTGFEHVTDPLDLTDLELDQFEAGFERWDFFDFRSLDEFFGMLEGERVLVRTVDSLDLDRSFTHLRMHFRDLEFGFVFVTGTDRAVAAVVDGAIVDCTVVY